jgi:hypothetical protein
MFDSPEAMRRNWTVQSDGRAAAGRTHVNRIMHFLFPMRQP